MYFVVLSAKVLFGCICETFPMPYVLKLLNKKTHYNVFVLFRLSPQMCRTHFFNPQIPAYLVLLCYA